MNVDFTSGNYLDYRHDRLPPWSRLTTGLPPALGEFRRSKRLAAELAGRLGRPAGVLETSSLHAFVDGWAALTAQPSAALVDAAAYPLGRIGLRATGLTGSVVRHFDPGHVSAVVARLSRRPVLLVDGLCPGCGRRAPLPELVDAVGRRGVVLVDETQSMGVGRPASLGVPSSARLVVVASLAKGFGAPLAVLAGPADVVTYRGPSRVHASGPSAAAQAALSMALAVDGSEGERRRKVVRELVALFRSKVRECGLPVPDGGRWPMQTVPLPSSAVSAVRESLLRRGIRCVAVHRRCRPGAGIAFLINASHTPDDIERAVFALASVRAAA